MQGGTEKNAACLRDAIRRHCHVLLSSVVGARLISRARLTVDPGALYCGGQARLALPLQHAGFDQPCMHNVARRAKNFIWTKVQ
jgi:hypothetical protein